MSPCRFHVPSNVQNTSPLCMKMGSSRGSAKYEKNMEPSGSDEKCEMIMEPSGSRVKYEMKVELSDRMLGRYLPSKIGRNLFV